MPTEAKRETIGELRAELDDSRTMIISEYRGLRVKEIPRSAARCASRT